LGNEVILDVRRDEDDDDRVEIHRLLGEDQLPVNVTERDYGQIHALLYAVAEDVSIPEDEVNMRVNRMMNHIYPPSIFIVVKVNRIIRGLIISETGDTANTHHVGWLRMEVHPDFRHRGLGTILLDQMKTAAKSEGLKRLEITSYEDNQRAARFFRRNGFAQEGYHPLSRYNPKTDQYIGTYTLGYTLD
jgi:ribosomal protein S18 acetylase RimI-like enzyme